MKTMPLIAIAVLATACNSDKSSANAPTVTVPDGAAYAQTHTDAEALDEALRLRVGCGDSMSCLISEGMFENIAFRRAKHTPGFCEGVPPTEPFAALNAWTKSTCKARGMSVT